MESPKTQEWADDVEGTIVNSVSPDHAALYVEKLNIYLSAQKDVMQAMKNYVELYIIPCIEECNFEDWDKIQERRVDELEIKQKCFLAYKKSGSTKIIRKIINQDSSINDIHDALTIFIRRSYCNFCKAVMHNVRDCPVLKERPCKTCGQKGHLFTHCRAEQTKVCGTCGNDGHLPADCRLNLMRVCGTCGNDGHLSPDCRLNRVKTCETCGNKGHTTQNCNLNKKKFCVGCKKPGHLVDTCKSRTK